MKKMLPLLILCASAFTITTSSCLHSGNESDVNLTFNESEHYYSMNAFYNRERTREVDRYLDKKIGSKSHMSFINTQINGTIALDDHTTFYMKKSQGTLEIKLYKDENSDEAYHRIKSMCEGIKKVIVREHAN